MIKFILFRILLFNISISRNLPGAPKLAQPFVEADDDTTTVFNSTFSKQFIKFAGYWSVKTEPRAPELHFHQHKSANKMSVSPS
jgi:hypothetical protein